MRFGAQCPYLVQEYIAEAKGCDIRCLVVGNEVVAAIERCAKAGDFRSNLHRGGVASIATITPRERDIAIKAAQTLGLDVAGVDILRAARAAGDGGECLAGTGRYRKDYGRGYRGANDSVDRTSRYA